jgi:hypothetical protein
MSNNGSECLLSVDGTDFKIPEPSPFDRLWYSHKFNHAALRYEVAICIQTGWICWIYGPFPAGFYPDDKIFRMGLKDELQENERVEADSGYKNEMSIRTPDDFYGNQEWKWQKGKARARHENINGNLKQFKILDHLFRHRIEKHGEIVNAVAAIVQCEIMNGRGTHQVDYNIVRINQH